MDNAHYQLLVVDDEKQVRQTAVAYLEDSGFTVAQANSCMTGLELFNSLKPDLVITDLKMPDIDGIGLLTAIREESSNTPVIVISGAGIMDDVVKALRLGASDFLIKPIVDLAVLEHAVLKSLERTELQLDNERYRNELEQANTEMSNHLLSIEQDQEAGHFVQQCLLPISPFTAIDYTFSHYLKPSLYLSGDTVDYAVIDKRFWAFYLADVSGHGSASAFVGIWLKNLVKQLVRYEQFIGRHKSVADALQQLMSVINDELIGTRLHHHLTCIVGIVDTLENKLYYVVAGHLPLPILITSDAHFYLEGKGKPVGLFKQAEWQVFELSMQPEFSILCFSDGVLEILPPETLVEKEAYLLDMVKATGGHLSSLIRELSDEKIANAPDDITILSICKDV